MSFFGVKNAFFSVKNVGVINFGVKKFGVKNFGVKNFGVKNFGVKNFGVKNCYTTTVGRNFPRNQNNYYPKLLPI